MTIKIFEPPLCVLCRRFVKSAHENEKALRDFARTLRLFALALRDFRRALWLFGVALCNFREALSDFGRARWQNKSPLLNNLSRTREFEAADLLELGRIGSVERFDVLFDKPGEVNEAGFRRHRFEKSSEEGLETVDVSA
jgi:hypothetical protein